MNVSRMVRQPWPLPSMLILCVATIVSIAGCGKSDGPQRYDLHGTVTFRGQPVPAGTINFTPNTTQGNSGPGAFAQIRDGHYETSSGKGIVGGPHRVMIFGFPKSMGSEGSEESVPELFPPYQAEVELPREDGSVDFEVPATGKR